MTIRARTLDQLLDGFGKQQYVSTRAGGGDVSPAEASADETGDKPEDFFDYALSWPPEDDDTDEFAFPRSRNVVFSASSDGIISIHHRHSAGITLTAAEARDLYSFLTDVALIWRRAK